MAVTRKSKVTTNQDKKVNEDGKVWYINTGGGSFRFIKNKIIKPKERFLALPEQIPAAFNDVIKRVDGKEEPAVEEGKEIPGNKPVYKKIERVNAKGYYDVVDVKTEKAINEKALRESAADSLVGALNS